VLGADLLSVALLGIKLLHARKKKTSQRRATTRVGAVPSASFRHENIGILMGEGMGIFRELTPAPTREVVLTTARELAVGAAMDLDSPALSAKVLRFGSGSLTKFRKYAETKRIACHVRGPFILCLRLDIAGSLDIGFDRALPCDSEISERPLPGDGIRLGGAICDLRIN
jgi:hypothetical protein